MAQHTQWLTMPDGRRVSSKALAQEWDVPYRTIRYWVTTYTMEEIVTQCLPAFRNRREAIGRAQRGLCTSCGGPGPFYKKGHSRQCIPCLRRLDLQRDRQQHLENVRAWRLRCLLRRDPLTLTRRQRHWLMRRQTPPGKKYCSWGNHYRRRTQFHARRASKDGLHYYCKDCQAMLDHLTRAKKKLRHVAA